ncbi:MAG: host attachment family protein [Sphingomonadales bacterium]
MHIRNNCCVLVTDGRKSLFFRNEGDARFPNLKALRKWEDENPADRDQKSDAPGRSFASPGGGGRRSAFTESDFHEVEESRFAARIADFLREQALAGGFDELIVVAPPRTLGELRKHYHREVERRVTAEIAKDLVKHPVSEIERLISRD